MKYYHKIHSIIFSTFILLLVLFSCKTDDEKLWDAVVINEKNNSFVFAFTSSEIAFAGDYTTSIINRLENNQISNVNSDNIVVLSLYPYFLDPLYNANAEKLLFDYDESGENTFENYPAFVCNTKMYNFDTTNLYQSIQAQSIVASPINVGTLIKADQGMLKFYVKVDYKTTFSKKHSVAIYLYEKEKNSSQETSDGTVSNFTHKNVFIKSVNDIYGEPISGDFEAGQENKFEYEFNAADYKLKNLGIVTIIYELNDAGKPIAVINSTSN